MSQGAQPALAAAGDLDPSFDGDGIVIRDLGFLRVSSEDRPPPNFALRLDESPTARLTWESFGDQLGYVLLALPQGGAPRTLGLAASARSATDQTGGTNVEREAGKLRRRGR